MKLPPIPKHVWALDDTGVFYLSLSLSCLRMTIFKYCLFNTQLHLQQHLVFPVIRVLSGPALQTPLPRRTARHVKRFRNNIDGYIVDV